MKKILYTLLAAGICVSVNSCFKENIPQAGVPRHEVTELKGVPGDEEVQLSWSVPEGWEPTDYLITYNTDSAKEVRTGGEMSWTVQDLQNGTDYVFKVQAVYGDVYANPVKVSVRPVTGRIAVKDLDADAGDGAVTLTWTKPSTAVLSYTLTYCISGEEADAKTVEIGADEESFEVTGLTNDRNYTFSIVANYKKGESVAAVVKAMPTLAIPFILDRTKAAVNQPITFKFNREDYPDATDVKWTFPDGTVLDGETVESGISSSGTKTVVLSATVKGRTKTWNIEVEIRDYVIEYKASGFKGSCPVFSPDGKTLYDITYKSKTLLYAFDLETGEIRWTYTPETASGSYNPLTVNPVTGDIYYGTTTAGQFYAVTSEGNLKWQFKETGSMQSAAPAVSKDGATVYVGDKTGKVFALDAATGSKKWDVAMGAAIAGLLVNGEEIIAGATNGTVKFLKATDGSEIKSLKFAAMTDITGFAVAADRKTVYLPSGAALGSFSLETREIIVESFKVAGNNVYEPVVSPNGDVFVGSKDSKVYCVDKDLTTVKWSYSHSDKTNAFNYSHPCVDSDGNFYITAGLAGNKTYIFTPEGTVKSSWTHAEGDADQKQMGGNNFLNGVIYYAFIGNGNGIIAGQYVGGERAEGWSTHGGDICGSCCIK